MPKTHAFYKKLPELRKRFYSILPGKESLLQLLDDAEVADHVYNSNAIENSTLSLEETEKILLNIDLDRFISQREMFEAKNLARVVEYIRLRAKEKELDRDIILLLHKMLISNIRDDIAGRFRVPGEWVRVGSHIAPASEEIESRMTTLLNDFYAAVDQSIISRIAQLHLAFEYTHPFVDGNGRIGRVVNNYLLLREGYVPINIAFIDRSKYYDAFGEFQKTGKTDIMEELVGRALVCSYHKRLAYMESKKIVSLSEYAKEHGITLASAINKAKRQTIEAFLEKGEWKIGV